MHGARRSTAMPLSEIDKGRTVSPRSEVGRRDDPAQLTVHCRLRGSKQPPAGN